MYADGGAFNDHDVHRELKRMGVIHRGGEWYECTPEQVKAAVLAVRMHIHNEENRTQTFKMRPEQQKAVEKTVEYFKAQEKESTNRTPKFLWNAKMRFGKTFASYQLAKRMGFTKVLILTFKPAVQSAWKDDLLCHMDFVGWQFISQDNRQSIDEQFQNVDLSKPIVCFGSFQDFLGQDKNTGGIKSKNKWVHSTIWDLVIFDEYHFGAWKENAKKLFEPEDEEGKEQDLSIYDRGNAYDETFLPISTKHYLYLSGTPFRALNSGEFIEEQIYNWTYTDEQKAKLTWSGNNNPYLPLPRMVMLTYKIPESIQRIARQGEFNEFDLNLFFKASGSKENAHFDNEEYVQKWLDLIRGQYLPTEIGNLKLGKGKPPMPFSDTRLTNVLSHTLWFLPDVAACTAMKNLLERRTNSFYHAYKIIVAAGKEAGVGAKALEPVQKAMENPLETKTITLTCGKLTTGVTVRPWTGIFMLRNLSSPETYFQAAFRVQSPWTIQTEGGEKEILKMIATFSTSHWTELLSK